MKILIIAFVFIIFTFLWGCTTTVTFITVSTRCDVIQGTNTVEKTAEGGGSLDVKGALK